MFHKTTYTVLSTLIICSAAWAADAPTDPKIATNITITGCLHAGENSGQFVLLGVTEKTATGGVAPVPYAIYMLDSTRDMKPLVGQLVDIKGVVVKRYAKSGSMKISLQDDAGRTPEVKVESGSGKVASTKDFEEKSAGDTVVEMSRPVYKVNVDSIAAVDAQHTGPACK
ncbi:MAG: hypothetical protein EBY17_23040 [Acidobacteriia bacterium]|nr:hypothetical protein [Terriglobia bacterium]